MRQEEKKVKFEDLELFRLRNEAEMGRCVRRCEVHLLRREVAWLQQEGVSPAPGRRNLNIM